MPEGSSQARVRRGLPGYTMIEMIMVISTVAIVAALAVPMLGGTANNQLGAAARMLAADIDHARIASITRSDQPTVIVFADDGRGYHLAYAHDTDEPIGHPIDHGPYAMRFGQAQAKNLAGVRVASLTFASQPVLAFGRFGQLQQSDETDAEITLTTGERSIILTIDAISGEVAVGPVQVH